MNKELIKFRSSFFNFRDKLLSMNIVFIPFSVCIPFCNTVKYTVMQINLIVVVRHAPCDENFVNFEFLEGQFCKENPSFVH